MKAQMKFDLKDKKRIFVVFTAVILMGFSLSFLIRLNFGTDPCSSMNLGIAKQLGLSFGTWQVTFNTLLFIFVFLCDRSQVGWGTISNMILVGYSSDFFTWIFNYVLPSDSFANLGIRIVVLVPSLVLFIIAAAVYMTVDLGSSPYDATSFILASKIKSVPFGVVRICWDFAACIIGFLMGSTIGIVTVAVALTLGPVITMVRRKIKRFF